MLIVGLTGSLGMGKSTVAKRFIDHGIAVFDADQSVHDLYRGALVDDIAALFPKVVVEGKIDRSRLSKHLRSGSKAENEENFAKLEAVVHPKVRDMEQEFLLQCYNKNALIAVLEVPLLFETGLDQLVDVTVVVSAPPKIRDQRVFASRPDLSKDKLRTLIAKQMPDEDKRTLADYVIDTSGDIAQTYAYVDDLILTLKDEAKQDLGGHALQEWGIG
ncbi:MAG: dephospho-CoA kinase [Pseudomonadota bacterium]